MRNGPFLTIGSIERVTSMGEKEAVHFEPGVNLLVGRPNTGKTKWLQMLDHLLGDQDTFEASFEEHLFEKYDLARAEVLAGSERLVIERKWKEPGAKTRIFVNGEAMPPRELQHLIMEKLNIPILHFPKGNPMSGQTWPELSLRMLMRHIYRQQRFWSGIADQQPDAEQHACVLQFVGIAEHIFTEEFGELIQLRMDVEKLKSRREQYSSTLNELARDVLSDPEIKLGVTEATLGLATVRLTREINDLRASRGSLIINARDHTVTPPFRTRIQKLSEDRADLIVGLEELKRQAKATAERLDEMIQYRADLKDELDRLDRAEDAGAALADLRITHCPACDQSVVAIAPDSDHCFLCHQILPNEIQIEGLGSTRLQFERDRMSGELLEANDLVTVLDRDTKRHVKEIALLEERLRMLENELAPARQAVSALIHDELSAIDVALGELSERQRQLGRVSNAFSLGQLLSSQIEKKERLIEPLQARVDEAVRSTDFGIAENRISDGMNAYLANINLLRNDVWVHNPINVDLSRSGFSMKVGNRRWNTTLGGTDTLYFLMAYHYGLLTLSSVQGCHYPGLSIIDLPGEFVGELVEDKENFIVQPFIDLLAQEAYGGAQVIIAGASFAGLDDVRRISLTDVYAG